MIHPNIEAISAAQRWTDGWRGGLLATCSFDLGFHGPWHAEVAQQHDAEGIVLVEASAGLVDPGLIDRLIEHAESHPTNEYVFLPAAPGFGAMLLKPTILKRLAAVKLHPGRLLHYFEEQLGKEPLATESCAAVPTTVARTTHRFSLDSDRQIRRLELATRKLNGQLKRSSAEELVSLASNCTESDHLPREIVLELNTNRSTRPIYWPGRSLAIHRPEFTGKLIGLLFDELAGTDDVRLTLAGVGDPLLSEMVFSTIERARGSGCTVHVETDLHGVDHQTVDRLAGCGADVISIHLPAISAQTYAAVMGCDGYAAVLENIRELFKQRQNLGNGTPIIVPTFTKCAENLAEMERWYDQWLRVAGSAVIRGPSHCGGQVPDVALADMSPTGRRPCSRIQSRLTILSDGRVVSCEEDVAAIQSMGRLGQDRLADIWKKQFEALRQDHRKEKWVLYPLCAKCREWHRP